MKAHITLLLFIVYCAGCDGASDATGNSLDNCSQTIPLDDGVKIKLALAKISVGTDENELVATMKPYSLDIGTVYFGGTGARQIYFQIANDKQIWFLLSGPTDGDCVTEIGSIEPKRRWIRHNGGSITID